MKILKLILITIILGASCSIKSQNINTLTEKQYQNSLINGVNCKNINATKGDLAKMERLMKVKLTQQIETEPNNIIYLNSNGLSFHFEQNNPELKDDYILYGYEINNSKYSYSILGKQLKVGDDISKLGNIKTTILEGVKIAIFHIEEVDAASISIEFDENDKINTIKYTVFY